MTATSTEPNTGVSRPTGSAYYPTLVAVFTGLVLISNVSATKGIAFGPIIGDWSLITDGGFIVFPLTYVIGDVLSEVYGFKATRRAIYIAFAMEALAAFTFWLTAYLPAADFYTNQAAFEAVVKPFTQLIIAGLAGFIVGQTLNAWVVVRIKARTKEKHLWARLIGSTIVGSSLTPSCSAASPRVRSASTRGGTSSPTWHWAGCTRPPSRSSCCR